MTASKYVMLERAELEAAAEYLPQEIAASLLVYARAGAPPLAKAGESS